MKFFLRFWRKIKSGFHSPRIFFPLMTGIALAWFFIRVIPKPIRATYPCQQAAFPIASAFVIWLLGLKAGFIAWLRQKRTWWKKNRRFVFGGTAIFAGLLLIVFFVFAADNSGNWVPTDPPNSPMGVARGIHPGRVVWVHDPTVTTFNGSGYYGDDAYTSVNVAGSMISRTIQKLTDATNDANAWDAVFKFYNQNHSRGNAGYHAGENIIIKVNCNNYSTEGAAHDNKIDATPQMVKALLRQLVGTVGVAQTNIYVYDCQRYITWLANYCNSEFPGVNFRDKGSVNWATNAITFATNAVDAASRSLPDFVTNTTYMINMAVLKRHCATFTGTWSSGYGQTAITCCMKNNFGSSGSPSGMHTMIRDWNNGMGSYNALVDLNGSKYLEGKTVLYLIDGLFSGTQHNSQVHKWNMAPFNGYYPCSLFASQDLVAIDSVALDFLRTELGLVNNADNPLHEAALANNPPSHFVYAPDGTRLPSLGVHEHWNNSTSKQYSRNVSPSGTGIELVAIPSSLVGSFSISAMPSSQTISAGSNAIYAVNYNAGGYAGDVALSVSGLPAGVNGTFNPATVNATATNSTFTVTTFGSTPDGIYPLTINAVGNNETNVAAVTLIIGTITTPAGALYWTAGSGTDTNWSTPLNWTNLTALSFGPPGISNDVIFNNTTSGQTNFGDLSTTINSLWFALNPPSGGVRNQTTVLKSGTTVNIVGTNILAGGTGFTSLPYSVLVGTNVSATGNGSVVSAIISGAGTINVNRPDGVVAVAEFNTTGNHPASASTRAVWDLSGLDNFSANISQLLVGCMNNGSSGTFFLAKTNSITAVSGAAGIDIGNNNSNAGDPSAVYLGRTNRINANFIRAGAAKGRWGLLAFNPAFSGQNLTAFFRGTNGDNSRVAMWIICDLLSASGTANVAQPCGTNDFTGGTVNALIDSLVLGKTTTTAIGGTVASNRLSIGVLTFDSGVLDVNNLTNGFQLANGNGTTIPAGTSCDSGIGIVNVNGGILKVNNQLVLGAGVSANSFPHYPDGVPVSAIAQGTLNINNGTVQANSIITGNFGLGLINMNNGVLVLTNAAGSSAKAISSFAMADSTLHLNLNGSAIMTNICVTNFTATGVNTVSIDSIANVGSAITFPLISYNSFSGSVSNNFVKGMLPAGFSVALVDNPAQHRIDLVVADSTNVVPRFNTLNSSVNHFICSGSNGLPKGIYYVLASTNLSSPVSQWRPIATNPFDAGGCFYFTNFASTNASQTFYLLKIP